MDPAKSTIVWNEANASKPPHGIVLVAMADGEVWTAFWDRQSSCWRYPSADRIYPTVTHWADFPPPPAS